MNQRSDFPDGVQNTRSRLIVCRMNQPNIGVFFQYPFHQIQIRQFIHGKLQIHKRQLIIFTYLHSPGTVCTIIYH
ncbi:hypothetical protein IMSAG025_01530 [Muribaculaceae bacterium]|nr:hypothetical protein IMSAG025_01530 [Muribaculaceae bacterium]